MTNREKIYALLAALGLVVPWIFNIRFMLDNPGAGFFAFFQSGMVNAAATSLSFDLAIACITFFVWIPVEARKLGMRNTWLYFVLAIFIAYAFAFPLFLWMRERRIQRLSAVVT